MSKNKTFQKWPHAQNIYYIHILLYKIKGRYRKLSAFAAKMTKTTENVKKFNMIRMSKNIEIS